MHASLATRKMAFERRNAHAHQLVSLAGVLCAMAALGLCTSPNVYANVYYLHHSDITKIPVHVIMSVRSRMECVESCIRSPNCLSVLHGGLASLRKQCTHLQGVLTLRTGTVFMLTTDVKSLEDVSAFVAIDPISVEYEADGASTISTTSTTSSSEISSSATSAATSSVELTTTTIEANGPDTNAESFPSGSTDLDDT